MGFGTTLYTDIYFSKETYNSKYEVEQEIEECKNTINSFKERIKNLSFITEPKKFIDEETDPVSWISSSVDDCLEVIMEENEKLYKLEMLLERWDETHDEKDRAIVRDISIKDYKPPYGEPHDIYNYYPVSIVTGDFIKTNRDEVLKKKIDV